MYQYVWYIQDTKSLVCLPQNLILNEAEDVLMMKKRSFDFSASVDNYFTNYL